MKSKIDRNIIIGFALAIGILLLTAAASFWSIRGLSVQTARVEHTYQVLQEAETITAVLKDAQAGTRGYLLTGDTVYLRPYSIATGQLPASLERIQALTVDNPAQRARLDSLRILVEQEFRILRPLTEIKKSMSRASMQTLLDTDRQTLRQVRVLYARIKDSELALLAQRSALQDVFEKATPIVVLVSAVLAILIVVWLVIKIAKELADNRRLQGELADINAEISRRIAQIRALAEQVVQGDYTVKITDTAEDNLGGLATSLNRMTQTLDASFSALEKRNQELDQFAYVASHDLKAPLRGVTTIVKWIEDELAAELSPQLRTYLEQMKGRLARLEDLINGLLAYARVGRTTQATATVDVAQLLGEVAELVVPPDFTLRVAPDMPSFVTDRLGLQQVFTNLLSNAVKYHQRGAGHLEVTCREAGPFYEFRVQDDGPGIAPEYHQKIFLLFQTLRDRHTAESTGIGLSIVQKIINEHHGSIRVESVPGQGAGFIFTWPK
ncbi:CHASE3 domain-containing protein [Hymenobacter sp. BT770]|uniref:sensor histidine kinase n=1 Tax=Hymenobacter sp. BT770 TaxID=2886942 RepID=UPI001D1204D3|nr:sensor histidine kinase [Hymenobacter sp. BT770]MCC3153900.1 CHASE3 domain-containing protein [Hymenobacter sp. BT770]MDO3416044.1 CHASE3 domain-containing protein [Hymenobacter sp. BT770]